MAMSQPTASFIALMALFLAVFSLIGGSFAAEAPAPSPASSGGAISPSFAVCSLVTFVAAFFGSVLKM